MEYRWDFFVLNSLFYLSNCLEEWLVYLWGKTTTQVQTLWWIHVQLFSLHPWSIKHCSQTMIAICKYHRKHDRHFYGWLMKVCMFLHVDTLWVFRRNTVWWVIISYEELKFVMLIYCSLLLFVNVAFPNLKTAGYLVFAFALSFYLLFKRVSLSLYPIGG